MARYANFQVVQGTPLSLVYTVKDSTGNILNLTGYTGIANFIRSYTDPNETSVPFTVVLGTTNGQVTISLTAQQTISLALGRYSYNIYISNGTISFVAVYGLMEAVEGVSTRGDFYFIPLDESVQAPLDNGATSYSVTFTNQTSVPVNHNLNSTAVFVAVYDTSGQIIIPNNVQVIDLNNVTVTFAVSQSGIITVIK